jgi:small subunit ribosomal protein S5|tara:strand:+ start:659 stop:1543 length:885 start_codon:yes stop_codon:yes gene_type:complete
MVEPKETKMEEKSEEITKDDTKKKNSPEEQLKEMTDKIEAKEKAEDEKISKEADKTFRAEERRGEFKRESREERFAREAQEKLDNWVPKTDLGRAVRSGKIKSIEEVFEIGKKIMEPQIVDLLIPGLRTDTLFIGQAKGKFGGGKRRAFRQTQKKTKEGNVLTFGVMAVVGDGKGHVGIGYGRSAETLPAKEKAIRKAKLNIVKIPRGCASFDCSCDELHSIPVTVSGKCSSVSINLMPAPQGTGLVVGDEMKKILRAAGIKDIYSNSFGKVKTTFNTAKALMQALNKIGEIKI